MDDPLVPESLRGNTKWCVYGGVVLTLLFVGITIILNVVFGSKKGHPAWFVLALAMLGILLTTCVMLNWLRQNTVEEKMKYVVVAQLVLLTLFSVASLIDITKPEKTCPDCVCTNPSCYTTLISDLSASPCSTATGPTNACGNPLYPLQCFLDAGWLNPGNGTITLSVSNLPTVAETEAVPQLNPTVLDALKAAPLVPVKGHKRDAANEAAALA